MLTNKHIGLAIAVTNIIVGCIVILNNQIRLLDLRTLKWNLQVLTYPLGHDVFRAKLGGFVD